jgi:hypothetical protein
VVAVTRKKTIARRSKPGYEDVLADVVGMIEAARRATARAVTALPTATYWTIGRRLIEQEQDGKERADYGPRTASVWLARCG